MKTVHSPRPYFFEVFTVANFIVIELVLRTIGLSAFTLLGRSFLIALPWVVVQLLIGIAGRALLGGRAYLQAIRDRGWIVETARLSMFYVLSVHVYGWIKVSVPLLNRRLYDEALADFGRALFFGHSPAVFAVNLFSNPTALQAVDWTYANVFVTSLFIAGTFFLSSPDRKLRVGFMDSNVAMWLIGAWIYVALPALGPAYAFPDVWLPLQTWLPQTQFLQRLLMTNYQTVLRLTQQPAEVNLLYGVAAFPSLHVAFEMLVFLWMYRVSHAGRVVFAIFTVVMFIGSLVTGWHHLIDSVAGLLLATLCWAAFHALPLRFARHAQAV